MLNRLLTRIAVGVLETGMRLPAFGPARVVYTRSYVEPVPGAISNATKREFEDGPGFFERFEGLVAPSHLDCRDLLDLGSGYGGRTLYYAREGSPRSVVGLEIRENMATLARSAASALAPGAHALFAIGRGEELPFKDNSFDYVFSYDVFEHVSELAVVLSECCRVLKPGGRLLALFPPYFSPRAHHLDFITTLPFLHHVFPCEVLVQAANEVIARHPELERQPFSSLGRRTTLPTLNGTTERGFQRFVDGSGLEVEHLQLVGFAWGPGSRTKRLVHAIYRRLVSLPWPFTRDVFSSYLRCILRKRYP